MTEYKSILNGKKIIVRVSDSHEMEIKMNQSVIITMEIVISNCDWRRFSDDGRWHWKTETSDDHTV